MNRMIARDRAQLDGAPVPDMGLKQNFLKIVDKEEEGRGWERKVDIMHSSTRSHSQTPEVDSKSVRLGKVLEAREYAGANLEYEYDFGDSWAHRITMVGRSAATSKFRCLEGEGHGVAKDVGSWKGWEELKYAYRTVNPNAEQRERREWSETIASNCDPLGLGAGRDRVWDKDEVNALLLHL